MKLSGLTIIAALAAGTLATAPVLAQRHVEMHRTTVTTTTSHHDNSWHQRNHGRHKVCRTRWVNHHKVRRCTWQRW